METGNAMRFVEEESHGWTILSTAEGEDLVSSLALRKEDVSREEARDGAGDDGDQEEEEDYQELGEVKKGEDGPMLAQGKRVFDSESADFKDKERSPFDGVTNAHVADGVADGVANGDSDGEDENFASHIGDPYIGGQKNSPWKKLNPNEEEEEEEDDDDDDDDGEEDERKKGDLEGHLNNKNGCVFWRASFFATLGFLGWVIINNTFNGGSGKDLRCMKLHPCAIKGGGAHHVLDSV